MTLFGQSKRWRVIAVMSEFRTRLMQRFARRAKELGVARVPAVAIDGKLVDCCAGGIDLDTLKAAGLGQQLN